MFSMSVKLVNVNTVEHIKFHTDFHVFFCLFDSTLPVELSKYTVPEESSFRFQSLSFFSASAFCLLCMHAPGFPPIPQGYYVRPSLHLTFKLRYFVTTGNGESHQDVSKQLEEKVSS